MEVVGIICEYNPMHKGHIYQIEQIRSLKKGSYILCLMSGDFVQRGGPAIYGKWSRTKSALSNGADLVIQLPTLYSTQSASIFSNGAVGILDSLKVCDYQGFSTENLDENGLLERYEKIKEFEKNKSVILNKKNTGISNIAAVTKIQEENGIKPLTGSNDILGFEYIKALKNKKSRIKPLVIKRCGGDYNSDRTDINHPSATAIRKAVQTGDIDAYKNIALSKENEKLQEFEIAKKINEEAVFDNEFLDIVKYKILINNNKSNLNKIFEVDEGIENLLIRHFMSSKTVDDIIDNLKSKRYSYAKLRRMIFNILLDIKKKEIDYINEKKFNAPYARILGFNENGRKILKKIKENSDIKLINKLANFSPENKYEEMFLKKDIFAANLYSIARKDVELNDFKTSPVYFS